MREYYLILQWKEHQDYNFILPYVNSDNFKVYFLHGLEDTTFKVCDNINSKPYPSDALDLKVINDILILREIPIHKERILNYHDITNISLLKKKLKTWKVLYIFNLPLNYFSIFENIQQE